jgi:hypothetical protein
MWQQWQQQHYHHHIAKRNEREVHAYAHSDVTLLYVGHACMLLLLLRTVGADSFLMCSASALLKKLW